jgi:hypothetical protein
MSGRSSTTGQLAPTVREECVMGGEGPEPNW